MPESFQTVHLFFARRQPRLVRVGSGLFEIFCQFAHPAFQKVLAVSVILKIDGRAGAVRKAEVSPGRLRPNQFECRLIKELYRDKPAASG